MRIALIGAGALGTIYAALLAQSQPTVECWLVGAASSAAHFHSIRTQGLRLTLADSVSSTLPESVRLLLTQPIHNLRLSDQPDSLPPIHIAIVLVKGYRTADAAQQIRACLQPDGLVLTLQNGLGNAAVLRDGLPYVRVIQGITYCGANTPAPGHIHFTALRPTILPAESHPYLDTFAAALQSVGAPITREAHMPDAIWRKLLINSAINALGGLLNLRNGDLLLHEPARSLMHTLVAEALPVAQAEGALLDQTVDSMTVQVMQTAEASAQNWNSLAQDLQRARRTEIVTLNGAVLACAARHDLPVPTHRALVQLIQVREQISTIALPSTL
jgi:2-dehydropantoate 2-reductase